MSLRGMNKVNCPHCGALYVMVGQRHRCIPRNETDNRSAPRKGDKSPSRLAVAGDAPPRGARTRQTAGTINTPEASGKARKAPSGKAVGAPALITKPKRTKGRASPIPKRKRAPKGSFDRTGYMKEYMRKKRAKKDG